MGGGTEAFPDLGRHCQRSDCNQLDFLPFACDACHKVFCLDHRSCKSHECPNPDQKSRTVIVCEACSAAIETTGGDQKLLLEKHTKSGTCDPSKKKKPSCPVKRCKEVLTFSNSSVCKSCHIKVCLGHRFPADHACAKLASAVSTKAVARGGDGQRTWGEKFLAGFVARSGKDCGTSEKGGSVSTKNNPSVKAC